MLNREIPKPISQPNKIWQKFGKQIYYRKFRMPDSSTEYYYFYGGITPAIILPITAGGQVISIIQYRFPSNQCQIELPGGVPAKSEQPPYIYESIAKRELYEETGYCAGKITRLIDSENPDDHLLFDPASYTVGFIPFLATDCVWEREANTDKTEFMETMLIPWKEWLVHIMEQKPVIHNDVPYKIRDAKSIATTFLARPHMI